MIRQVGHGLETRPLLTVAMLLVIAVALAAAVTVFVFAAVLAAIIATVGFLAINSGRELLRPKSLSGARYVVSGTNETTVAVLRSFLGAVEEFTRLTGLALSAGIDDPPRGRTLHQAARDARRLRDLANRLAAVWHGSASVAECMVELEAATTALDTYLGQLQRTDSRRASAVSLRWRREDLSHRRDTLTTRLREADFRAAASVSGAG